MLSESRGVVRLAVHVQPGAKRSRVVGAHGDAMKIAIAAPPVDGKANDAICTFVASLLGVPTRSVTVTSGAASRRKVVSISGASLTHVQAAVAALLANIE